MILKEVIHHNYKYTYFTSFENKSFDIIYSSEPVQKFYQHLKGRYEKLKEENKTLEAQAIIFDLLVMKADIES